MTVSNDEKPMLFLHSDSFGTLIRKQAFHTRLSRIFHPCILVPHFPILHFPPLHFWPSRIFRSRIFSRPMQTSFWQLPLRLHRCWCNCCCNSPGSDLRSWCNGFTNSCSHSIACIVYCSCWWSLTTFPCVHRVSFMSKHIGFLVVCWYRHNVHMTPWVDESF